MIIYIVYLSVAQQARVNIIDNAEQIRETQSKLGSLSWLTHIWPDILFSYSTKEKSSCATKVNMHGIDEIQRIIYFMVKMYRPNDYGLTVGDTLGVQLVGTVDTSYVHDKKSCTGGTIHMGPQYGSFITFPQSNFLWLILAHLLKGLGAICIIRCFCHFDSIWQICSFLRKNRRDFLWIMSLTFSQH